MKIIADICVIPLNTAKASVREEVAIAHQILLDTGCSCNLHSYGTNVEGDYDVIMNAIKKFISPCMNVVLYEYTQSKKIGSRTDKIKVYKIKQMLFQVLDSKSNFINKYF